jgi:hypothetical protein
MRTPLALRQLSLRAKLIAIFIAIKVVPLVLLAAFAWQAASELGQLVTARVVTLSDVMRDTQLRTGQTAITDAIEALDDRSRDAIETLTTGAAREIAAFLYDRDQDLLQAATLAPDERAYANFLATHQRLLEDHGPYVPDADGERWVEQEPSARNLDLVRAPIRTTPPTFTTAPPTSAPASPCARCSSR